MNYYNFHIGDYASHTRGLSLIEDLAYRRILDLYYLSEKPLTGEYDIVARKIGMPEYADEIEYVLVTFFEHTPDGFINKRADAEIQVMKKKQESARENANKRWNNVNKMPLHSEVTAIEMPSHSDRNATKTKTNTNTKLNNKELYSDSFNVFWESYPRKESKKEAAQAFVKVNADVDILVKAIKNQIKYKKWDLPENKAYIPHAATWLNQMRWEDEVFEFVVAKKEDKSWMMSNQGIEAKAQELGVNSYGVANHQQLKDKILQVMAKRSLE